MPLRLGNLNNLLDPALINFQIQFRIYPRQGHSTVEWTVSKSGIFFPETTVSVEADAGLTSSIGFGIEGSGANAGKVAKGKGKVG